MSFVSCLLYHEKTSSAYNFWMRKELRLLKVSLKSHSRQSLPFVAVVAVVVRAHNFPSSLVFPVFTQIQVFNEIMLAPNINKLVLSRHVFIFFFFAFFHVDSFQHQSKNAANGQCIFFLFCTKGKIAEPLFLFGAKMKTQTFHTVDINLITSNKTEAKMRDR